VEAVAPPDVDRVGIRRLACRPVNLSDWDSLDVNAAFLTPLTPAAREWLTVKVES
jgi:hypothetical protein